MAAPRVDFYVLTGSDPGARLRFACRLVEKAWLMRNRVRVQFDAGGELAAFDQMLWTFSDRSFVPHRRAGDPESVPSAALPPVVLADTADADASAAAWSSISRCGARRFEGSSASRSRRFGSRRRQRGRERLGSIAKRIEPATTEMRAV